MTLDEFRASWHRFASHWATARADDPAAAAALIDRALESGLASVVDQGEAPEGSGQDLLDCEIAVITASGLFDAEGYKAAVSSEFLFLDISLRAGMLARHELAQADPVRHFCTGGWRTLINPSLDFDGWWYWTEHLDPRVDTVNPFLHYLLEGRQLGWSAVHTRHASSEPQSAPTDVRRICLFAGFDPDGIVDDHVVGFISDLARFADVYYLADCDLRPGELDKLAGITRGAWAIRHGAYDFGSYSMLAKELVGWDVIDHYDELLLANDSCYLLKPLDDVFARMDAKTCDWWGLQLTARRFPGLGDDPRDPGIPVEEARAAMPERYFGYFEFPHIGSYFLVYRRPVVEDPGFRRLLDGVAKQAEKAMVIQKYEIGFSRWLVGVGYEFGTLIETIDPFHPVYSERAFDLIGEGFPFLKRLLLAMNYFRSPDLDRWKERVREHVPDAPVEVIERHLVRTSDPTLLQLSLSVTRAPDGSVVVPPMRSQAEFVEMDHETFKFLYWWGFVVDPATNDLSGNARAIFEEVRQDPSIRTFVFSRGTFPELPGANVEFHSDRSWEGQDRLARCRFIFVNSGPRSDLQATPVPTRRNFVHLGIGMPGGAAGSDLPVLDPASPNTRGGVRMVLASLAGPAAMSRVAAEAAKSHDIWPVGVPRHDLLLRSEDRLPAELVADLARLRSMLGGRPLVLCTGGSDTTAVRSGVLAGLPDWCAKSDLVLGVRDLPAGGSWRLAALAADSGALRLDNETFSVVEVLLREASILVTSHAPSAVDFLATGRPVVAVSSGADAATLEQVAAEPLVTDADGLLWALDAAIEPDDASLDRVRAKQEELFGDVIDDQNAWRVVKRIRSEWI